MEVLIDSPGFAELAGIKEQLGRSSETGTRSGVTGWNDGFKSISAAVASAATDDVG